MSGFSTYTCLPASIAALAIGRVQVVGSRDQDRVEVLFAVQQLAKVGVLACLQELLAPAVALFPRIAIAIGQAFLHPPVHHAEVHVADRGDVLRAEFLRVPGPLPADPDDGEVQPVGRRLIPRSPRARGRGTIIAPMASLELRSTKSLRVSLSDLSDTGEISAG